MAFLHSSNTVHSSFLCNLQHLCPIRTVKTSVSLTHIPKPIHRNKTRFMIIGAAVSGGSGGAQGGMKEQTWTHEGLITESLSNGMFKVGLENGDVILGHVSGKIRQSHIRILPGDRVKIEVSRYDSSRGRITYRLRTDRAKGTP